MNLRWHPEARIELGEATMYFNIQESELGDVFIDHVFAATEEIKQTPLLHSQFDPPYRKVVTERFSYQVIYLPEGEEVFIIAVMHQSRKPGYWKSRLKD